MAGGAVDSAAWEIPPWRPSRTATPVAAKNREVDTNFLLMAHYSRWIKVLLQGRPGPPTQAYSVGFCFVSIAPHRKHAYSRCRYADCATGFERALRGRHHI